MTVSSDCLVHRYMIDILAVSSDRLSQNVYLLTFTSLMTVSSDCQIISALLTKTYTNKFIDLCARILTVFALVTYQND